MFEFEVGDIVQFTQVDIFEYEEEEQEVIELEKDYIIIDFIEDVIVFSDGIIEFILNVASCQYLIKVRDTKFKIGDSLKFERVVNLELKLLTSIKVGEVYKVIDIRSEDDVLIIHDGVSEVALYIEDLLYAIKVNKPRAKRKPRSKKKNESEKNYTYTPLTKEVETLQNEISIFMLNTLIDKALDERDFKNLERIVSDPTIRLNNENT